MSRLKRIAEIINKLTYDEMMEMAVWFSAWTVIDDEGNEQPPTINSGTMAANLSDWANHYAQED